MATTEVTKPQSLDIAGITDPDRLASKRKISASLDGDQLQSSVANEGTTKLFDKGSKALGKQDFLELLVTQLKFQDPLQPTENTEFVAQLAQFSNLEGTQNINKSVEDLGTEIKGMVSTQQASATTMSNSSATSLLGKTVRVDAKKFFFDPAKPEGVTIDLNSSKANSVLSILNADGEIVNAIGLPEAGDRKVKWNGQKADGTTAPQGTYTVKVTTPDGKTETGYTYLQDVVTGIGYSKDGLKLELRGQQATLDQIMHVSNEPPKAGG
jgi:flagellar basal-body rod modification protein FlgD